MVQASRWDACEFCCRRSRRWKRRAIVRCPSGTSVKGFIHSRSGVQRDDSGELPTGNPHFSQNLREMGHPALVVAAVKQSVYEPQSVNGIAITSVIQESYHFGAGRR